jgi:hypothetical protein
VSIGAGPAHGSVSLWNASLRWYRKAVEEQGLDYRTLKRIARNSIGYCFADAATKTRLKADLDAAFHAFEATVSTSRKSRG